MGIYLDQSVPFQIENEPKTVTKQSSEVEVKTRHNRITIPKITIIKLIYSEMNKSGTANKWGDNQNSNFVNSILFSFEPFENRSYKR